MRRSWLAAALVLVSVSASGQPLKQELQALLVSHPEILSREKSAEAAREGIRRAKAAELPRVDLSGEVGPEYIDSPLARDLGGGTWQKVREVAGMRVTQRLFDGFATPSEIQGAKLNLEVAEFTADGTRQNILFEGINAYIEVLRQQQLVALARDSEKTIMRQLNLEDERVQRGAGIAVDVLQAKSRLQLAKERRIAFEGGLKDAIARYIRLFNHPPDLQSIVAPPAIDQLLPDSADIAIRVAEDQNPAIDASYATVGIADERRRLARSDYFPRLDVVASANRERDSDLVRGTRTDLSVVLQATWNLFNGFATDASIAQAAYDYRAAQDNFEAVRRKVVEQTRLAWEELSTARERVELLNNAVAIATEVFEARQKLREAGRETVINVLDAENELYNARINLIEADGDRIIAAYRLLQGMGRLDATTLDLD